MGETTRNKAHPLAWAEARRVMSRVFTILSAVLAIVVFTVIVIGVLVGLALLGLAIVGAVHMFSVT